MGAAYSAVSGLLAIISRAYPRFLSPATHSLGSSVVTEYFPNLSGEFLPSKTTNPYVLVVVLLQ